MCFLITSGSLVTGFNLLGNPYPSSIDWNASGWQTARNLTNVYDAIYIYNPALTASTSSMTYPTYLNGTGTNGGSNIIRSGQAFFVNADPSASISFLEAYKSTEVTGGFFRSATPEMMRVTYMQNNEHLDDIVIRYNDDAQAGFDPRFDAISMGGDANGLASFKNADRLAIQLAKPLVSFAINERQIMEFQTRVRSLSQYRLPDYSLALSF